MAQGELDLITIIGPTASGKTTRAVWLAREMNAEIISGDSRQVYKGMTIGTGKDLEEYGDVPYHLIDIRDAGYKYNLHEYITDFNAALADIKGRGRKAILCGGTGMYVENALSGIRLPQVPENSSLRKELQKYTLEELTSMLAGMKTLHNVTDVDTKARAVRALEIAYYYKDHPEAEDMASRKSAKPLDTLIIGIDISREARRDRISRRLRKRLEEGMIDEVQSLLDSGIEPEALIYYGLEYKYVTLYLTGKMSLPEMTTSLETAIHQFAKRQMTWFRGMERRGWRIHWLPHTLTEEEFLQAVKQLVIERNR